MKLSIGLALAIGGQAIPQPAIACALPIDVYTSEPSGLSLAEQRRYYAYEKAEIAKAAAIEKALRPFNEQKRLWETSEQVFIARIESVKLRKIQTFWRGYVDVQDVELRPLSWLKGQGPDQAFMIGISSWSDCGPDKRWDALSGKPGEKFVVFVENGPPSNETVSDAIGWTKIVDPEVNIALAAVE